MTIMEITTYTVPTEHADALASARPAIAAAMGELDGLERVESIDLGEGRMADVAIWRDADAHAAAMQAAAEDERLRPLFTLIEDVEMRTGTLLA